MSYPYDPPEKPRADAFEDLFEVFSEAEQYSVTFEDVYDMLCKRRHFIDKHTDELTLSNREVENMTLELNENLAELQREAEAA